LRSHEPAITLIPMTRAMKRMMAEMVKATVMGLSFYRIGFR
jgi:hypothetical protein